MSLKLKILGMALLACAATSAFAVTNASGTSGGHFTHDSPTGTAWITAHEAKATPSHQLKFTRLTAGTHNTTGASIECEKATYIGTAGATVDPIELTPTYTNCNTEGGAAGEITVDVNGCSYTFSGQGARKHGTANVDCPAGKAIEITHPNCTTKIPAQTATATTLTEGISYHTVVENVEGTDIHALTATVTVKTITGHFEGGICVFLGTNHKFEMVGSVTVTGLEDLGGTHQNPIEGKRVNITST